MTYREGAVGKEKRYLRTTPPCFSEGIFLAEKKLFLIDEFPLLTGLDSCHACLSLALPDFPLISGYSLFLIVDSVLSIFNFRIT